MTNQEDKQDNSAADPISSHSENGDRVEQTARRSEPAFNVPLVILLTVVCLTAVHLYRLYGLTALEDRMFLLNFAFFPIRFDGEMLSRFSDVFTGGYVGALFSLVSYGFLHADWLHLIVNCFWMLVFGSALARRFGVFRFLLMSLVGALAGALAHLASNWGSTIPVVGASAAVSAHMACAARFAFVPYGPLGRPRSDHPGAYFLPALSIPAMFKNGQVVGFLVIWFAVNLLFGLGSNVVEGGSLIAWEAHVGGFMAGLLLFPLFDPQKREPNFSSPA